MAKQLKKVLKIELDVTKIDKERLFKGEKGTYLDATTFIDLDQQDKYGNNGFIAHSVSKEEREAGVQGAIVGNAKVFYKEGQKQGQPAPQQQSAPFEDDDLSSIPF